jgi:hypothetical protein
MIVVCIRCKHYEDYGLCVATAHKENETDFIRGEIHKRIVGEVRCRDRNPNGQCELFHQKNAFKVVLCRLLAKLDEGATLGS